jgi:hypothetical protein
MPASIAFLISAFAFAACGPRLTDANFAAVEKERVAREGLPRGLSPKEVESILGLPRRTESTKLPLETQKKEVEVVRYYYEQHGQAVELHFVDGKLISPVKGFGAPASLPDGVQTLTMPPK